MTNGVMRLGAAALLLAAGAAVSAEDWPEWRGPRRDGRSTETGLPERWSPAGENLAWRAPYGGRSGPVVVGDRVYVQNVSGDVATAQERVMCLDAQTGKPIWERRFSVYLSDVPQHRAGWASPSVDVQTGNVYALTVGAQLIALTRDGKTLWSRSLPEEYGAVTTHGGRTVSPVIEGDTVVVNVLNAGWGEQARTSNRYMAFDKRTGEAVWVSTPQKWHYDTNYATPVVAEIDGMRLLIVGGTDGVIHALNAGTGEPVWNWHVSKRAINNSVVVDGATVYMAHGEENTTTSEMGMVAAVNLAARGELGPGDIKWTTLGFLGSYPSPVFDAERIYHVDNGAMLGAFDRADGRKLWDRKLGTIQKGSPVLADGKLYVGTENGKFFILRPKVDGVDVLDEDLLGTPDSPEPIIASPAISNGRVYVVSMNAIYAIGPKAARLTSNANPPAEPAGRTTRQNQSAEPRGPAEPARVLVYPAEVVLAPGQTRVFRARLFDANGRFIREEKAAWSLERVGGAVGPDGAYTAPADGLHAGAVKATVGSMTATARVRVFPPLPWAFDFESHEGEAPPPAWIHATGRFTVRDLGEGSTRGMFRATDSTVSRRVRTYMGPSTWSNYTVEADVRAAERRRQMGDVGIINQRYVLVLFGNSQRIELHPWQAADEMTVRAPFAWTPGAWYRMKLRVDNLDDGTTRVRGKAWPAGEPEPEQWLVGKVDSIGHREGSPGLYSDAGSDINFDNVKVYESR